MGNGSPRLLRRLLVRTACVPALLAFAPPATGVVQGGGQRQLREQLDRRRAGGRRLGRSGGRRLARGREHDASRGRPVGVAEGGNSAKDTIGTVQLAGGNTSSGSTGTVQVGPERRPRRP